MDRSMLTPHPKGLMLIISEPVDKPNINIITLAIIPLRAG